jgi:hypothetical protein
LRGENVCLLIVFSSRVLAIIRRHKGLKTEKAAPPSWGSAAFLMDKNLTKPLELASYITLNCSRMQALCGFFSLRKSF